MLVLPGANMQIRKTHILCVTLLSAMLTAPAMAHPGRTNAHGCHAGSQPYHCHTPSPSRSTRQNSTARKSTTQHSSNRRKNSATLQQQTQKTHSSSATPLPLTTTCPPYTGSSKELRACTQGASEGKAWKWNETKQCCQTEEKCFNPLCELGTN